MLDPPPPHGLQIQFLIFFTLNDFPTFDNNDDDDDDRGSLTEIDRKTPVYQACGYTTGVWVAAESAESSIIFKNVAQRGRHRTEIAESV